MLERGRGHLINLSSEPTNNYKGSRLRGSTAFVRQFSLNLRCDLLGTPIRVSSIEPGMSETTFTEVRYREDPIKIKVHYKDLTPLSGDDLADVSFYTTMLPNHENINSLQVPPGLHGAIGLTNSLQLIHRC